jgi:hypothetical protein
MCTRAQTDWQLVVFSPCLSVCRSLSSGLPTCLRRRYLGIPFGCPACHLSSSYQRDVHKVKDRPEMWASGTGMRREDRYEPSTSRFFSGNRLPLATVSNREDQMFFLEPSLLVGRLFAPAAFDPGFKLEDIVSSPTMPQRAFTLSNLCLYRRTAEIPCAWKC